MHNLARLGRLFYSHPLTRKEPLKAWLRFVWWQIRSRLKDEIIVPWIAGMSLAVRNGMTGATGNIYVGLHEFPDMMLPLHFLRPGDLFLDVGANVGSYTVLASGVCGAETWAFEPDAGTARNLKRNVAINKLEELVTVYEVALGDAEAEVAFTIGLDTMNKVAFKGEAAATVSQKKLDDIIGQSMPTMIKIDVEGYEEKVIHGASKLLENNCLKIIELETVTPRTYEILVKNGFEKAYYEPFTRQLHREPIDNASSNSVFVRDRALVSSRVATANRIKIFKLSI